MRILVTGGTGLIGRQLLPALAGGHEVWATVRHAAPKLPDGVTPVQLDLTSPGLAESLPDSVDTVIHLAQSPRFRDFPEEARHIFEVNIGSTARLLDWARRAGARSFLYASSGGIYGRSDRDLREDEVRPGSQPLGYYLASKQCGELLVENYAQFFVVGILRFFFVYGPGQRDSMLIPRLIRSVAEGRPVTLHGSSGLRLNPVHVDDAVRAVVGALGLDESTKINIAGPETLTLREIAESIGAAVGRRPVFSVDDSVAPAHIVADTTRMRQLLGSPQISFSDAVRDLSRNLATA